MANKALRWHIVTVEGSREHLAAAGLVGRWFNTYLPALRSIVIEKDGKKRPVWRALFPGYLFVLEGHQHQDRIKDVPGVTSVLKIDGNWAMLDDIIVKAIARQVDEENDPRPNKKKRSKFKVGDMVRIVDGSFGGFTAPISALDENERITLLLDVLGRRTATHVTADQIRAA